MAVKTEVHYTDDLTGKPIPKESVRTRQLVIDGVKYELHFSYNSNRTFDAALKRFIDASLEVSDDTSAKPNSYMFADINHAEVRAWGNENGHEVNDRGRVPAWLIELYLEATA